METIELTADDGTICRFYIEEQTRVNGTDYLLVSDAGDGDANAYIFKDISDEASGEAAYVPVTDERELEALMKIFSEMLDDADLTM
jgi:nitrogen regulatory protein PII-like uncharacterized protein